MHMKYNAYEVFELLLFVFDMGYNKKKYPFFSFFSEGLKETKYRKHQKKLITRIKCRKVNALTGEHLSAQR